MESEIIKIIKDRIDDAEDNINNMEIGHPMESTEIAYLDALKDLKKDLKRSGLWKE